LCNISTNEEQETSKISCSLLKKTQAQLPALLYTVYSYRGAECSKIKWKNQLWCLAFGHSYW